MGRRATIERRTSETDIRVVLSDRREFDGELFVGIYRDED